MGKRNEKTEYDRTAVDVISFEDTDIIATSEVSVDPDWNGDVDPDGWI